MNKSKLQPLRENCLKTNLFDSKTLEWIQDNNLWNLWVPKSYGGMENSLTEGLKKLEYLAKIDGSLGWTVTLCSGANYFIGNLNSKTAEKIFSSGSPTILGGSGGVFGTAEKQDEHFILSGEWRYATGAPYLTHFTLNAKIVENGKELKNADGSSQVLSFVLPKTEVSIVDDWNTMGLKPTATYSFTVNEVPVHKDFSFLYNQYYLSHGIFKIPFALFADLTLWVNYIGMAEHYLEEASSFIGEEKLALIKSTLQNGEDAVYDFSKTIEKATQEESEIISDYQTKVHEVAADNIRQLSKAIIEIHPLLGIKASRENSQLNQIFRDFFTATQHHNFVNR